MNPVNVLNTAAQQITNFDTNKLLLGGNDYVKGDYVGDTYDDINLTAGLVMGRIASTNKVVECVSTATDGSELPIGILANDTTIEAGETRSLTICVKGQVARELVTFSGSDTFATVVDDRTYEDRIMSDTAGIILSEGEQLTGFDNQ